MAEKGLGLEDDAFGVVVLGGVGGTVRAGEEEDEEEAEDDGLFMARLIAAMAAAPAAGVDGVGRVPDGLALVGADALGQV